MATAPQRATLAQLLARSAKVDARLSDAERRGIQQHLEAIRVATTLRRTPAREKASPPTPDGSLCAPAGD
ncbi:hypothetical protein [Variovorax sp. ZT4R33]|uniref:hypothetical protein n=1 Tax=Variovorax sp. ZT4R33 TaxID=3443743 RepID=UPI003F479C54